MNVSPKLHLPRKVPGSSTLRPTHSFNSPPTVSIVTQLTGLIPGLSGQPHTDLSAPELAPIFDILNNTERIDPEILKSTFLLRRLGLAHEG